MSAYTKYEATAKAINNNTNIVIPPYLLGNHTNSRIKIKL